MYLADRQKVSAVKVKSDSIQMANSKNEFVIKSLKVINDSLVDELEKLDSQTTEFRLNHYHLPTGAKLSPQNVKSKAKQFRSSYLYIRPNVLYKTSNLSFWGNDKYGDCVTAEEAFAKASYSPGIFIPESVVVDWASENGVLNGANIEDVLKKMNNVGFRFNSKTYNDGGYAYVDFTNVDLLKSAIAIGPVKLGVTSTQLERAWRYKKQGWLAVNFATEQVTNENQHCISICGYGTLFWLANQFNVILPPQINGQELGYAIFTWGSIGIIDQQSLLAITHEAWLRNPVTTNSTNTSFILRAMGGEFNKNVFLSHAENSIDLRKTYSGGFGEMWICHDIGGGKVKLEARGKEAGKYLSHAFRSITLRNSYDGGSGEEWLVHSLSNGQFSLEALGAERGFFLSHAFGDVKLRRNQEGGEAWLNIGQK